MITTSATRGSEIISTICILPAAGALTRDLKAEAVAPPAALLKISLPADGEKLKHEDEAGRAKQTEGVKWRDYGREGRGGAGKAKESIRENGLRWKYRRLSTPRPRRIK